MCKSGCGVVWIFTSTVKVSLLIQTNSIISRFWRKSTGGPEGTNFYIHIYVNVINGKLYIRDFHGSISIVYVVKRAANYSNLHLTYRYRGIN